MLNRLLQIWCDETEWLSSSRILLWITVLFSLVIVWLDAAKGSAFDVPQQAYTLLGGMFTGLIVWAGGPRVAPYLAEGLKGVASAIASSKDRQPDRFKDDER